MSDASPIQNHNMIATMALSVLVLLAFVGGAKAQQAHEDSSQICVPADKGKRFRIGVRHDAPPFSYWVAEREISQSSEPYAGYSVDLCLGFVASTQNSSGLTDYCFSQIEPKTRFGALADGDIDLLCGATTGTVEVRSKYRTSLMTYLAVSGLTYLRDGPVARYALEGREKTVIGVRSNTTSASDLKGDNLPQPLSEFLQARGVSNFDALRFFAVKDHWSVPDLLREGVVDIYFADRPIIEAVTANAGQEIEVYNLPIALQPYSILIADEPFGKGEEAGEVLQQNFDRYLIEEKFAPDEVEKLFEDLRSHLAGKVEPVFLDIARIQGVFP